MEDSHRARALTRRQFSLAAAATALCATSARAADAPAIDTHAHVFHNGLKRAADIRYSPDYDAKLDDYLRMLDANGLTNGVLVQPSFLGTDNSYILECLGAAKGRVRAIAVVDPAVSADELKRLNDAGVVGIRLNLVGKPLPDLASPVWQAHLAAVAKLGWQVEVQRAAVDLATLAPKILASGVNLVLDHFALPDPKAGVGDPGFLALWGLAPTRRVWIKISAPYRMGPDGEVMGQVLFPILRDTFGLDRLLWGSDWPNTGFEKTQTYEKNRAFLNTMVADEKERAQILANPKGLFKF